MKLFVTLTLVIAVIFLYNKFVKRQGPQVALAEQRLTIVPPDSWPELPIKGFITGIAATKEDVESGRAGFVAEINGKVIGKPLTIMIPQYAYHFDKANGHHAPGIIIQAEEANGLKIFALRALDGTYLVGLSNEFQLLGATAPQR